MDDININTIIIPADTCLVRGSDRIKDATTPIRFFGYFGHQRDIKAFCESKKFVEQYARDGKFQYMKVKKPLKLIALPYMQIFIFDEYDAVAMLKLMVSLLAAIEKGLTPNAVTKYGGKDALKYYILKSLLADVPQLSEQIERLQAAMERLKEKLSEDQKNLNVDYPLSKVVCELGYNGWARIGSFSQNIKTEGDELMICSLDDLEESSECNLGTCPTTG